MGAHLRRGRIHQALRRLRPAGARVGRARGARDDRQPGDQRRVRGGRRRIPGRPTGGRVVKPGYIDSRTEEFDPAPALRHYLAGTAAGDGDGLDAVTRYAVQPPGKLVRPVLLVESAAAVGADPADLVPIAVALEYLHVATLVHDDIIDGDLLRRGRPTVHARYGRDEAIVAGDALLLDTFRTLTEAAGLGFPPAAVLEAVRIVAVAGLDLCRGQAMEAGLAGDLYCGMARYRTMAGLKTGALFIAACAAGAVLGGGSGEEVRALRSFADHLGCAFQMRDDLLPYLADTSRAGKSSVTDIVNQRPTFPVLVGIELADTSQRWRIERSLDGRLPADEAHRLLRQVLTETGALAEASARVAAEVAAARADLAPFGVRGERLIALADSMIGRTW
ncbi:dimethylallyltranstransferase [Nocardia terpenica]|uniref:Dimethylallyltranstransferase n=1 Tax=Nocardia terpenica TaxID=455432 RepID=A0A291RJB3_9NOCA|nr:dimethylallyltranstransferase [Nocardia terpenica]